MSGDAAGLFATYLCLVYHEARNVRHLIKAGFIPPEPYEQLRAPSLPKGREDAWAAMQNLRREAALSGSAQDASKIFARRYGLNLDQLVDLYEDKHWRHSSLGGNQWAGITRSVIELRDALAQGNANQVADLLRHIPTMSHNTGRVGDKLRDLDAMLGQSDS